MQCLVALIIVASLLQAGQCLPSHTGVHGGYAPVGYNGPLANTVVLKSGHIADTPEVSAAKHQHFSAVEKAAAATAAHGYSGGDDGSYGGYGSGYSSYGSGGFTGSYGNNAKNAPVGYHGPLAHTVILKSGHIADTPEVSAAKNLHYAAVQKAKATAAAHGYSGDDGSYSSGAWQGDYSNNGAGYAGSYKYSGPLAYPKVLPSGQLADTQEVAAARHAHWNAHAVTASEHAQKWANNAYH